nr:MAG TPA: hypothetical protein [Caudoviricetes sp.]
MWIAGRFAIWIPPPRGNWIFLLLLTTIQKRRFWDAELKKKMHKD